MVNETNGTSSAATSSKGKATENADKNESGNRVATPALVPIRNQYLTELGHRIRSRPIPWEGYARADLVTQDELKMIRSIDGKDEEESQKLLDQDGEKYASLYIRLLAKLTRTDTLQQILVLMGDMLEDNDDRAALFFKVKQADQGNTWPWHPLLKMLEVQDDFSQLKAAQLLTLLLVYPTDLESKKIPSHVFERLLTFLSALINSGAASGDTARSSAPGSGTLRPPLQQGGYAEGNGSDVGIQLLEALLRSKRYRNLVWQDEVRKIGMTNGKDADEDDDEDKDHVAASEYESIIAGLRAILSYSLVPKSSGQQSLSQSGTSTPNTQTNSSQTTRVPDNKSSSGSRTPTGNVGVQMVYQVVFCLWLFSFDEDAASELNIKFGFIPILADVARSAVKEKVVRIVVATLRNLVENAPSPNTSALLGSKGLPLMESLASRKWSDEEITEDINFVKEALSEKLKVMSTYDQFISELASGRLSWDNPAHSLDDFWKENTSKLLDTSTTNAESGEKGSGLEMLLKLIKDADNIDSTTLAIACNDIGKMIQFSPEGSARKKVEKAGGKTYIMALMNHSDGQVKFYALHTVSRLVSASWRT